MIKLKTIMTGLFLCVSPVFLSSYAHAEATTVQAHDINNYHTFFDSLKQNIIKKDKQAVAAVVKYPLIVQLNKKQVKIKNTTQFIKHYDAIITPKIEQIVKNQQFEDILTTYRGMAFGSGEIWFSGTCQKKNCDHQSKNFIQIIGINNFM